MVVVSVEKLLVSWCLAARCFAIRLLKRKIVDNIKNKDMYVYKYIYIYSLFPSHLHFTQYDMQ